MISTQLRAAFEIAYRNAADRRQAYVHFDLKNDGSYKEEAVCLAYEVFQVAAQAPPQHHADLRVAWKLLEDAGHQAAADRVFAYLNSPSTVEAQLLDPSN